MTDPSFDLERDEELGVMLRQALEPHHPAAFLTRMRARLAQAQPSSWDEELARWFWRGLAAASAVVVVAGFGLTRNPLLAAEEQPTAVDTSFAGQLLQGKRPGVEIFLVTMRSPR